MYWYIIPDVAKQKEKKQYFKDCTDAVASQADLIIWGMWIVFND